MISPRFSNDFADSPPRTQGGLDDLELKFDLSMESKVMISYRCSNDFADSSPRAQGRLDDLRLRLDLSMESKSNDFL